jgi:hypothetical protein
VTFTPASSSSVFAFMVIVVAVVAAVLGGVYRTKPQATLKVTLGLAGWLALLSFIVSSGALEAHLVPRVPLLFLVMNVAAVLFALSPVGSSLATLPLAALVGFQAFRLPLELVLHSWAQQGTIPGTMTWTGKNFDVVTGVVALLVALFGARSRKLVWLANIVGLVLLLNVARVALLSSPLPFAWPVEPPLQLIFHLPYALIGPVCVAGALAGHVILTRALLKY